jgi:capsid portal protein
MPDIIPAIGAIYGDVSRRNYNISFFENYGVPAYAVFITGDYDEGELDELGRSQFEVAIEEHFKAMKNKPHSTLIMSVPSATGGDVKVEFKPLSLETKEASFRLYRLDNRDEVLSAHAVPPYRAGIAETGSLRGSTAEEATEIYKMSVIEPRQEMLEAAINLHIVRNGFQVFGWEFKLGSIDNTDEKHDLFMLQGLFAMGCVTPNQIISFFGKRFGLVESDLPEMNYHYINGRPVEAGAKEEAIDSTLKALDATLQKVAYKNVQNV